MPTCSRLAPAARASAFAALILAGCSGGGSPTAPQPPSTAPVPIPIVAAPAATPPVATPPAPDPGGPFVPIDCGGRRTTTAGGNAALSAGGSAGSAPELRLPPEGAVVLQND